MSDRTFTQWDEFDDEAPIDQLNLGLALLWISAGGFIGCAALAIRWVFS